MPTVPQVPVGRWLTEGFHPAYSVTIIMYGCTLCVVTFALVVGVTLDS